MADAGAIEGPDLETQTDLHAEGFYLHGALHYFVEADKRLHELMYLSQPILEDPARLRRGQYPLIVTEGTSAGGNVNRQESLPPHEPAEIRRLSGALFIHGVSHELKR